MPSASKLEDLIALAKEPSSARRRELLREVTDLFFSAPTGHGPDTAALFDGVLSALAAEMEEAVRVELAERFAPSPATPRTLALTLASDSIAVAAPLLSASPALSEADLIAVVSSKGQEHLRAVSGRADLPAAVSDIIVARGDDDTLGVLLRNEKAALSRTASETAIDRAQANPALHEAVVQRESLPPDLLNEMYFIVEARLRRRIVERNAGIDPVALDAALLKGRVRLATRDGALPPDLLEAEAHIRALQARGALTPAALTAFLRHGERTRFLAALALMTEIDFSTARRIVERQELDALAVVAKVADFDQTLFLTLAVLMLEPGVGMAKAKEYSRLYAELPKDAALRTLRFWRLRKQTGDVAAA